MRFESFEDDDSLGEESEWDTEDDASTIPCPYCGEEIYEDAQRCPHCQEYVSDEDAPPQRKPWWIVIGALAVLYAVYRWILG